MCFVYLLVSVLSICDEMLFADWLLLRFGRSATGEAPRKFTLIYLFTKIIKGFFTKFVGMKAPLISIVTITFNAEKTLPDTLKSVAGQNFRDFEHVIVDGASGDSTVALARKYNTRILSEPDKGLYDAMNKGLALARGEYVLFLNSGDTFFDSDTLMKYASRARLGDDIVYGDTVIVNSAGNILGPRHYSVPEILTCNSFSKGMLICHQAFMVKRILAPKYDLGYRFSADYDWTIKCIKNAMPQKCTNLHTVTIKYLSDGLTDRNKIKSLMERYRVMVSHYGQLAAIKRHIQLIFRIK